MFEILTKVFDCYVDQDKSMVTTAYLISLINIFHEHLPPGAIFFWVTNQCFFKHNYVTMLHTVFWILILLHTVTVVFSKANSRRRREKISLLFFLKQKKSGGKLLHTVKSNKKTL